MRGYSPARCSRCMRPHSLCHCIADRSGAFKARDAQYEGCFEGLLSMGFDNESASMATERFNGQINDASEFLVNQARKHAAPNKSRPPQSSSPPLAAALVTHRLSQGSANAGDAFTTPVKIKNGQTRQFVDITSASSSRLTHNNTDAGNGNNYVSDAPSPTSFVSFAMKGTPVRVNVHESPPVEPVSISSQAQPLDYGLPTAHLHSFSHHHHTQYPQYTHNHKQYYNISTNPPSPSHSDDTQSRSQSRSSSRFHSDNRSSRPPSDLSSPSNRHMQIHTSAKDKANERLSALLTLNDFISRIPAPASLSQFQSRSSLMTQTKAFEAVYASIIAVHSHAKVISCDVRDSLGKWLAAEIYDRKSVMNDDGETSYFVSVHYSGWDRKWDEDIDMKRESHRFAPVHSHSLILPAPSWAAPGSEALVWCDAKKYSLYGWYREKIAKVDGHQILVTLSHAKHSGAHAGKRSVSRWFECHSDDVISLDRLQSLYEADCETRRQHNYSEGLTDYMQRKSQPVLVSTAPPNNGQDSETVTVDLLSSLSLSQSSRPKLTHPSHWFIGQVVEIHTGTNSNDWAVGEIVEFHPYDPCVLIHSDHQRDRWYNYTAAPPVIRQLGSNLETTQEEKQRLEDDRNFREQLTLELQGFTIVEIDRDGNCLFRAISYHLYGDAAYHSLIRNDCYNYIEQHAPYFAQFIDGDYRDYCQKQRRLNEWGDHVEIEAIRELYDCNIIVYDRRIDASTGALRLDVKGDSIVPHLPVLRLSFHGRNHYNAIVEAKHFVPVLSHGHSQAAAAITSGGDSIIQSQRIERERRAERKARIVV